MSGKTIQILILTFAALITTSRMSVSMCPKGSSIKALPINDKNVCQPDVSDLLKLEQQHHFWDKPKLKRINAEFDRKLIRDVYEPMDRLDAVFQTIQINKGLQTPKKCYENLTEEFCERVDEVVLQVFKIGAQSLFYRSDYSDPFIVQNYVFFKTYEITSFHFYFNFRSQKNTINPRYSLRMIAWLIFPAFITLISFNIWCLLSMLKTRDSSAFVIHLALQAMDIPVTVGMLCMVFPVELYVYKGDNCRNLNADWLQIAGTLGPVDYFIRSVQSLFFVNYILLTLITADRAVAIAKPLYYRKYFNRLTAIKFTSAAAVTGALVSFITCLNYHSLHDYLPNSYILIFLILTRATLITVFILFNIMQLLLTVLIVHKLLHRRKKSGDFQKDGKSKYVLVSFFSAYNIMSAVPTVFYMYCDTSWNLILLEQCNKCPVFMFNIFHFLDIIQYVAAAIMPDAGTNGFILHLIFAATYREQAIKLIRLKKILALLQMFLRISAPVQSTTVVTNIIGRTQVVMHRTGLSQCIVDQKARDKFTSTKNALNLYSAPSTIALSRVDVVRQATDVCHRNLADVDT